MAGWKDYRGQSLGLARIMADKPYSDGETALLIKNFFLDQRGFLDSTYRIMDFIPEAWNGFQPPVPFQADPNWVRLRSGVYAMGLAQRDGEYKDIIFLTREGVMRYFPWNRPPGPLTPSNIGNARYGLSEQYYYKGLSSAAVDKLSIKPQKAPYFPPQIMTYGNRMYFTFCDGGGTWVWDGKRVREFGYTRQVSPPLASGPERTGNKNEDANEGGFSHRGRIGTTESTFLPSNVTGSLVAGGIDNSVYRYAVLFENTDGAYSERSTDGPKVSIEFQTAKDATISNTNNPTFTPVERLQKKFRVHDIPIGPPGTVARVLLRTFNLLRLVGDSVGEYRFLHRIPNNSATEYIDDIPDGELGSAWNNRAGTPNGCYLLTSFSGSLFLLRNEAYPYRIWWSEQEQAGPIPESFMENHWLDVFPSTGPITGSIIANLADTRKQFLIIFKENACHYITGEYPFWQVGTLHGNAGASGPNLIQTLPNNSIVWFGTGTFWKLQDGVVTDIGSGIRKLLDRVNESRSRYGVSWVDREYREGIFALPLDDSTQNNFQFVYDYERNGWRVREDVKIDCVLTLPEEKCTLVAGITKLIRTKERVPEPGNDLPVFKERPPDVYDEANVYVYHRSYPSLLPFNRISTYITGWMSFSGLGPKVHSSDRVALSVLTQHERSSGTGYVSQYLDWDLDNVVNPFGSNDMTTLVPSSFANPLIVTLNPSLFVDFVVGSSTGIPVACQTPEDDNISNYGFTAYSSQNWRKERTYTQKLAAEIESHSVHCIKLETIDPMGLYNIDVYGPNLSGPGTRNQTLDP